MTTSSFRDPSGTLVHHGGRVLRIVNESGTDDLQAFLASRTAREFGERIVRTDILDPAQAGAGVQELFQSLNGRILLEHERIAFPSFPYEWPPEMLHAAGVLTLDLARKLLEENLGLKDGTPYNILFRGPQPVFIDLLSFERRDPADPTWLAYGQFTRTFLLPLLACQRFGLPPDQVLSTRRDGLEPEELYRWAGPLARLRPPFLSLVSMPVWLAARHSQDDTAIYRKKSLGDPEKARFILGALLNRTRRTLDKLAPGAGKRSTWSGYMDSNSYAPAQFQAKAQFVERAMAEFAPKRVLDAGANTGHFSAIAARGGASVVAIDYDPVVVGQIWRNAREQNLNILPLVVNLARPSPGMGWRNRECPSFLDRARGGFDAVLMLALIHHLLVSERIPLSEIVDLAAELTTDLAIIEFIGPGDAMFRRLTRGRERLHAGLDHTVFEKACLERFEIVRAQQIEGSERRMYLLRKAGCKPGGSPHVAEI